MLLPKVTEYPLVGKRYLHPVNAGTCKQRVLHGKKKYCFFIHSKIFIELIQCEVLGMPGIDSLIKTDKVPVPLGLTF